MIRRLVKAAFLAWIAKKVAGRALAHTNRSAGQHRRHAREAARTTR
jgi:hypothetical protein